MARRQKIIVPWPEKAIPNQRFVIYQVERITVNLLTMLNEGSEYNYEIYKMFLPKVSRRLTEASEAALNNLQYAPEGAGGLPVWLKITRTTITRLDEMDTAIKRIEKLRKAHAFTLEQDVLKILLDTCLDLLELFKKAPVDNGKPTSNNDDNNSYLLDLSSLINNKK